MYSPVQLKAELLSKGIHLSQNLIDNFDQNFLEKRRAYGNPDPLELRHVRIPQEVYIDPKKLKIIVSINVNNDSEWILDYADNSYFLKHATENLHYEVSYPLRPKFYNSKLKNNQNLSQVITLYGGGSLGIFAYGKCSLVEMNKPCLYCSISQNRDKGTDFLLTINNELVAEALNLALDDRSNEATQVMLNGGNFKDRDKSFLHYVSLIKTISRVIEERKIKMDIHLIVYPPENIELINELKGLNIGLAMNTEVFNPELFKKYCPGKVETGGQEHILTALKKAVEVLGKGNVFSILVGGLEPLESLSQGLNYLADNGIAPVINVLHTDPGTPLENFSKPTPSEIIAMGAELQKVYEKHNFLPFYENCGRNSIDAEAHRKLFQII